MEQEKQLTNSLPDQLKQLQQKSDWEKIEWHCLNSILQRAREQYVDTDVELSKYTDTVMVFSDGSLLPKGTSVNELMDGFGRLMKKQDKSKFPNGDLVIYSLIANVHHNDEGEWRIKVQGEALPLLVDTARYMTAASIIANRKFKKKYAAILYSEAFRHEDDSFALTFPELRSRTGETGYQNNVYNFNVKALQPALNEIKEAFEAGEAELWLTCDVSGRNKRAVFTFAIHRERERKEQGPLVPTDAQQAQADIKPQVEDKQRDLSSNAPAQAKSQVAQTQTADDKQKRTSAADPAQERGGGTTDVAQQPQERGVITTDPAQPQQPKPATPEAQADLAKQLLELRQEMAKEKEKQKEKDDEREKELKELRQQLAKEKEKFNGKKYHGFFGRCRLFLKVLFGKED